MLLQAVSVAGALLILGAYLANQRGWIGPADRLYSLLNAVGAGMLLAVALADRRWGFVLLEGTWMLLSLPPLFRRRGPRS